ncbi:MAG: hypothetical protein ACJAQ6_000486 [Arenicella sp.]|jgi:hypothetical protein
MQIKNKKVCVIGDTSSNEPFDSTIINSDVKAYQTPVLIAYGDVRDITLGGTLGSGESGSGVDDFSVFIP